MIISKLLPFNRIILASASPRRKYLLEQIGISCSIFPVDIDETPYQNEKAAELVQRLAQEKGERARLMLGNDVDAPLLSADTVVSIDHHILGKPNNFDETKHMLTLLSGHTHHVFTGVNIFYANQSYYTLSKSSVTMRKITEQEMVWYWETGEPQDKAGAFSIQGIGAIFIEKIEGSHSGIMGLPLYETAMLLQNIKIF